MSDDYSDLLADSSDDSDLVKRLRKALKSSSTTLAEEREAKEQLAKKDRTRTIQDKFADFGVPKKLARFALAELDNVDDESVATWLRENQEDFGYELKVSDDDAAEHAAQTRSATVTGQSSNRAETAMEDITARLKAAKNTEELMAILGKG